MSNSRVKSFFSVFSKSVQDEIMDFCRRITATNADVYITMARKAAAFCDCLEELGLIHLDGYVTSDRALDINGEWLSGKKVVIVDDAVVSGTTLYATIQRVLQCGAKDISVQILTVNEAWYNPELLQNDAGDSYVYPTYNKLPDKECIKLCSDIVQSISLVPRPYDVDFPLYKSIQLTGYELQRILALNNWEPHDLRTDLQKQNGILNFTLLPNHYELSRLSELFGLDITRHCIVKIRIYGRVISQAKKQYALRISPLIVFHELCIDTVKQMFLSVISGHSKVDASLFSDWSCISQLRLLQFYYSHQLASFWAYRIGHLVTSSIALVYSYRNLSFLFPEKYILAVETLTKRFNKLPPDILPESDITLRSHNAYSVYKTIDPVSINARLYEPFLEMYHEKELPCRRLVRQEGKRIFTDVRYKEVCNRLNEGVSFQDLEERLSDCSPFYDISKKVSLFIDYSIDAGIIVPIVQQEGRIIFRAYRHGEDVLFGRREEMMYAKMLSLFLQHSGSSNGISKMCVEKMMVLFSKIGLREKILYPYTSNFNAEPLDSKGIPMKILRVKPYLKGPIALVGTALQHQKTKHIPYITQERKSMWLSNVLIQSGQLIPYTNGSKYNVKELSADVDIALLTEPELTFVQNFAELAGRISNPKEETGISFTDNDWAKVSVTLTMPDTIVAVAAEMEIFFADFSLSDIIYMTGDEEKDMTEIKMFSGRHAFESIHNAIMKINAFSSKKGQELIRSVRFASSIENRIWQGYFSEELCNNSDENNEDLAIIFFEEKVWTYLMSALINTLFTCFSKRYLMHYGKNPISKEQYSRAASRQDIAFQLLRDLKKSMPNTDGNAEKMFYLWEDMLPQCQRMPTNDEEFYTLFDNIQKAIDQVEGIASNIQERVCDMLGDRGKVHNIISFNHVVHIGLGICSKAQREEACAQIEQVYHSELETINHDQEYYRSKGKPVPDIEIRELPQNYKPESPSEDEAQDVWFIAHGPKMDRQITIFAKRIFVRLYHAGIDCQITLFERLSYENCIISNTAEFPVYHCNQFNTFIELFEKEILFSHTNRTPCFRHICSCNLLQSSRCPAQFKRDTWFQVARSFKMPGQPLSKTDFNITEYVCTAERKIKVESLPAFDFGVITILAEEMTAVKKVFSLTKIPTGFGRRVFYTGQVSSLQGARRIICTQAVDQGECSVISAYHDMIDAYHPKFVFLIGIAGGVLNAQSYAEQKTADRPELDLCDVVIGKSVIDYELRKETDKGIDHRGRIFNVAAESATVVNELMAEQFESPLAAAKGSKNSTVNILFEPIGSGNAVIGNALSEIVIWLRDVNSKVAAVEMEAAGISSAFYEGRLCGQKVQGLLVIRGISDMANVEKELCKRYRIPAAKNAALVAKKLINVFPPFQ